MKKFIILVIIFLLLITIYLIYKSNPGQYSIGNFKIEYNEFRKENNIPLLPSNWLLDNKTSNVIRNFYSPNSNLGHCVKSVNLLKNNLGAETDKFFLTKDSILESRFERNTGKKFLYIHNTKKATLIPVTNNQANILLKKHNIQFNFNNSWNCGIIN